MASLLATTLGTVEGLEFYRSPAEDGVRIVCRHCGGSCGIGSMAFRARDLGYDVNVLGIQGFVAMHRACRDELPVWPPPKPLGPEDREKVRVRSIHRRGAWRASLAGRA